MYLISLPIYLYDIFFFFFFFFFQAEDGIRDGHVTGVQTCALPILRPVDLNHADGTQVGDHDALRADQAELLLTLLERSEERRVGKECRSRWWQDHYKKKKK